MDQMMPWRLDDTIVEPTRDVATAKTDVGCFSFKTWSACGRTGDPHVPLVYPLALSVGEME